MLKEKTGQGAHKKNKGFASAPRHSICFAGRDKFCGAQEFQVGLQCNI
jgi:hypothetical protein